MSFGWICVLLVIAASFYFGVFLGYRMAHVFMMKEIASSNHFLIGSRLYHVHHKYDLNEKNQDQD